MRFIANNGILWHWDVDVMQTNISMVGDLALPERLLSLIESGLWPRTNSEASRQDLNPFLSKERVRLIAPDENSLYLYPPPFQTIAKRVIEDKANFWTKFGALDQITPERCIDIGDFGIGSDTAIVLDYREGPHDPKVIRLQWRTPLPNAWVHCADSFDAFADMLGLENLSRSHL
jgi:hypothetical protein